MLYTCKRINVPAFDNVIPRKLISKVIFIQNAKCHANN